MQRHEAPANSRSGQPIRILSRQGRGTTGAQAPPEAIAARPGRGVLSTPASPFPDLTSHSDRRLDHDHVMETSHLAAKYT
jgi:hypothetical protein